MKNIILLVLLFSVWACNAPKKEKAQAAASEPTKIPIAIESFYQAFNTGDTTAFLNVAAPDFTDKMQEVPSADGGKGGVVFAIKAFRTGFPDLKIEIEKIWRDGNSYVCKTRISGHNTGNLFGMPATQKSVSFSAMDAFEIANDKIVKLWHIEQLDKMKQQLAN